MAVHWSFFATALGSLLIVVPAGLGQPATAGAPAIIPRPVSLELRGGTFALSATTQLVVEPAAPDGEPIAQYLADKLQASSGVRLAISTGPRSDNPGQVVLTSRDARDELGPEGYELEITPERIVIRAPAAAGLFYGVQTLLQLLPPAVLRPTRGDAAPPWSLPCLHIADQPRFAWRGLMVDTARHFFTKAELLDFIDVMALHKLNTLHWHINDDVGWRIEIHKYPKLTEVGAWRDDIMYGLDPGSSTAYDEQGRYGGFFTQDDVREIVAYAAKRYITIVPEFEMPAHSLASRRAYPELSCDDPPTATQPTAKRAYCAGKERTFEFLQDVLDEALPLFPGPIVHIGGDECNKSSWKACPRCQARMKAEGLQSEEELQAYFIHRMEKFLNSRGKRLMGWSEIRQGGIAPNALLMDWIGGGREAAESGHDVVMAPTRYCYLDYYQAREGEPRAIGGYVPLYKVYSFEPVPAGLAPQYVKHILGVQGNLWSEFIPNYRHLQYMAYPRACALAEVGWTPAAERDWGDFQARLEAHAARLEARGVNFRALTPVQRIGAWQPTDVTEQYTTLEWDVTPWVKAARTLRVEFQYDRGAHGLDIEWVALSADGQEVARDAHAGFAGGRENNTPYQLPLREYREGATYVLRAAVRGSGGTDSRGSVWLWP